MSLLPSWLRSRPEAIGPLGVLIVIALIESVRRAGATPPLPFLLVFAALVLAANFGGVRSALVSAGLMALFIGYSTMISFGSPTLTGGPLQASAGIAFVFAFAFVLGQARDARLLASELRERAHARQEALAELSQRALEYTDLDTLFREAVALLAGALRAEYCEVLELLPDGEALLLRAGVGWHDGLVGGETVPAGPDSQAGYTLLQSEPVVVEDLRTETRFRGPALLTDHGVVCGMSVVIEGDDEPFGVLGAHAAVRRAFTEDDVRFLRRAANVLSTAIRRFTGQQALREREQNLADAQRIGHLGNWNRNIVTNELQWSDEIYRIFGLTPQQFGATYQAFLASVHADDRQRVDDAINAAVGERRQYNIQYRIVRPDGAVRTVDAQGEVTFDDDGAPLRMLGIVLDVTERLATQQALRVSDERFRRALDRSSDAVVIVDSEMRITYVNDAGCALSQYPREEVLGRCYSDFFVDFKFDVERAIRRIDELGTVRFTREVRRSEGAVITVEHNVIALGDDSYLGVAHDITPRLESERAVVESEERLRTVFETVRSGLMVAGRDGIPILTNRAATDLFGYSREQLLRTPVESLIEPEFRAIVGQNIATRMSGEPAPEQYQIQMRRADGKVIDVDVRAAPFSLEGEVVGVLAELRDVTEELALRRRAAEAAEEVTAIVEAAPDAVIIADADGAIVRANQATRTLFGWEPEELIGRNLAEIAGGDARREHAGYLEHYIRTGEAPTAEELVFGRSREAAGRRRDGAEFPVEVAVAEVDLERGKRRFVAIIRDITERHRREEELARLNEEIASRANERQQLVQELLNAQEVERRRVAYDIHDGPAQRLAGAAMFLEAYRAERQQRESEPVEEHLKLVAAYVDEALQETRRVISELRPALLDDLGLVEALRSSVETLTERAGAGFEFDADTGGLAVLSTEIGDSGR